MGKKSIITTKEEFTPEFEKFVLDEYFRIVNEELDEIKHELLIMAIDIIASHDIKPQTKNKVMPIYRTMSGYIHGFDINDKGKIVVVTRDGVNEQKQLMEVMTIEEMKAFMYFLYYNFIAKDDSLA